MQGGAAGGRNPVEDGKVHISAREGRQPTHLRPAREEEEG